MRWLVLAAAALAPGCGDSRAYNLDGGDQVAAGAAYAQARGCASCHQAGDGSGTLTGQLAPVAGTQAYGGNLTSDRTTGLGAWADIEIVRAIRFGLDNGGAALCPAMPRYPAMGDVEAGAIVAYLRSLPSVTHAVPDSMCPPIKPTPPPDMAQPPSDL